MKLYQELITKPWKTESEQGVLRLKIKSELYLNLILNEKYKDVIQKPVTTFT